ncbi:hypothetical protein HZF05_20790 [Sphingomonas sp. CGMCC 1.13654]|uniref:DUF3617 family protein n=1 Tax=Sphingomonas chungangi TaxID=2683589 RepID=A0A838LEG8_9SPHN|nr:hypothetical protein [Sphingomonas chungangi]MBA2936526.1 hypothetical protein [Sphingomonas chungangi]MVW55911.1 hypothetical protein [Sphingomonas chungangi]
MKKRVWIIGAGLAAAAAGPATALPPLPDWQQLESYHHQDNGTGLAQRSILAALPPGTPILTARATLIADGATCRQPRNRQGIEKCLIHQYSLLDGAADDVRWTLTLKEERGQISSILVNRYVDRHGSA